MNEVQSPVLAQQIEPSFDFPESARSEPAAPPPPETDPVDPPPENFVYLADLPDRQACADDVLLAAAARLIAHPQAQTPISIGVLGGPGSGKSSALDFLIEAAEDQSRVNNRPVATVRIDASEAGGEPETLIAAEIYDALVHASEGDGRLGGLAREATASLRDVHAVAREAADRLAEMQQNLEVERRNLDSVSGRRARLAETILFETPGSRVDSYARAHRNRIEARLRSFGFEGDLLAIWKGLVREMAERNPLQKTGAYLQALWSYRGQGRLLALTVVFALVAWGLAAAASTRASWTGSMKGGTLGSAADWLNSHSSLFGTLSSLAIVIAVLCLAWAIIRATLFYNSVSRGASLLRSDLEARRNDLDALLAHQTRRVDLVAREVEAQARRAEDLERRAEGPRASVSRAEELRSFYGVDEFAPQARARFAREFMSAFQRTLAREDGRLPRLLIAVDGLESLTPEQARTFLRAAGNLLSRPGFVALYAIDESRIASTLGSAELSRLIQIPVRVAAESDDRSPMEAPADARLRGFDEAIVEGEFNALRALAPFAGEGPRDFKRFANLYRFARATAPTCDDDVGSLALAVLAGSGRFDSDGALRARARQAASDSGYPVADEALARLEPLTSRFRIRSAARG